MLESFVFRSFFYIFLPQASAPASDWSIGAVTSWCHPSQLLEKISTDVTNDVDSSSWRRSWSLEDRHDRPTDRPTDVVAVELSAKHSSSLQARKTKKSAAENLSY